MNKIRANEVRVGDVLQIDNGQTVVVTYASLRGLNVLIRFRFEGLNNRALGEKDMLVGKYTYITKIS